MEEAIPLDPVSENLNLAAGKPVTAAKWQAHDAHELMHGIFAEENADKPDVQASTMAHIKEHQAMRYLVQMEAMLGYELPPLEELQDPEVQNEIALALAGQMKDTLDQNQPPPPIDPNQLLMADIKQKEEENAIKQNIANLKAETDVFKAQLDFEKQKAKIESEEDIAVLRAETELTRSEMRNG